MRIAHVTATFPPYYGGTGNVCFHNAATLAARGHDVHVFTSTWPGPPVEPADVTVHRLRPLVRLGNAPFIPSLAMLSGFDIVHLHCPFISGAELVGLSSLVTRTPLVLTFHNDLIAPGMRGRVFALYERTMTMQVLRLASRVCVVSMGHGKESHVLRSVFKSRPGIVRDVPNGVDPDVFAASDPQHELRDRAGIPAGATVVAFVASLDMAHRFKRLDLLLRAIATFDDSDLRLLVIGDGELRTGYMRLADSLEISHRVHWAGSVAHHNVPPLLALSDLLVLPSDSVESFGLVLVEAMASEKPVIATRLPGVREIVADGVDGLLAEPGNLADLTTKLADMLADPVRRKAMGLRGREKVTRHYSWSTIGKRLEQIYDEVLDGPRIGVLTEQRSEVL